MAFCGKCGANIGDGVRFCPSCGTDVSGGAYQEQQTQQAQQTTNQGTPTPTTPDPNDAQQNKMMAIIAYILFFIPLLTGDHKKSPFVKYHTNQGTVLFLVFIAIFVVSSIISFIISFIIPFIGCLSAILFPLVLIVWLVLTVMGIINASNGKTVPLPVIGKFTIIK